MVNAKTVLLIQFHMTMVILVFNVRMVKLQMGPSVNHVKTIKLRRKVNAKTVIMVLYQMMTVSPAENAKKISLSIMERFAKIVQVEKSQQWIE